MRKILQFVFIAFGYAALALAADDNLNDPTRPNGIIERSSAHESSDEKLLLTLIRLGAEPLAVINGKTVQLGETIAGYRLISLQTTSATLVSGNGRVVLQLAPTIRKSISTTLSQKR